MILEKLFREVSPNYHLTRSPNLPMLVLDTVFLAGQTRLRLLNRSLLGALCAASLCASAHALERVNLRTGDTIDNCVRHESIDDTHIRLYILSSDPTHTDNYQDLPSSMIVGFETMPDPPPTPKVATAAVAAPADVHELLAKAGVQHNIDVDLLASIVHTESAGHANAVSRAGARGLMQLMPGTARDLGVADAKKPDQNIAGGSSYLDSLLTRYKNNLSLALAAYNAGPGAVDRYHGVPPYRETRAYVYRIEKEFKKRKEAAAKQSVALASVVVR